MNDKIFLASYYFFEDIHMDELKTDSKIINFNEDIGAFLLRTVVLAKNTVPLSHKRIADNFVVIKRLYKFHTVKTAVTLSEYSLLKQYQMEPLESTKISKAVEEIEFLKKASASSNVQLKKDADKILEIRSKELKNITASAYANIPNEMYNGYKAIEKYFEEITKFYK